MDFKKKYYKSYTNSQHCIERSSNINERTVTKIMGLAIKRSDRQMCQRNLQKEDCMTESKKKKMVTQRFSLFKKKSIQEAKKKKFTVRK